MTKLITHYIFPLLSIIAVICLFLVGILSHAPGALCYEHRWWATGLLASWVFGFVCAELWHGK